MKAKFLTILSIVLCAAIADKPAVSQEKRAQTGFQFLSVGSVGRAVGMGEAYTTAEGMSSSLFYNPAGIAHVTSKVDISASWNKWIADINYNAFSACVKPFNGKYGVFGISAVWVDYGELQGTMVWNNPSGFIDTEMLSPYAMAVGLGYAMALTDKFSIGGQIKYASQSLGRSIVQQAESEEGLDLKRNVEKVMAFDFGTLYKTGFKSLVFGMSVRNFSEEVKYEQKGFELPLTFRMGISMNVLDFMENNPEHHKLIVAVDAAHPRAKKEYVSVGAEYSFMELIKLRCGYRSGQDEYGISYGVGLAAKGIGFDFAYTPFGVFNNVKRITVHFSR